jgi:uncharacterized membrane protein
MQFTALPWLLFLPVALAAVLRWPALRSPARLLCLALLLFALVGPQIRRLSRGLELGVLMDLSASAADAMVPREAEMQALLERSRGADDRLFYVDFASLAQVRGETDEMVASQKQETRLGLAVRFALSRFSPHRTGRLLVLTDGYSTEPLAGLAERLQRQGVALDYRLITPVVKADYRVDRVELPTKVQTGEPFMVEVHLAGQPDAEVSLELARDGVSLGKNTVTVKDGVATARFAQRIGGTGAHLYTATVTGPEDGRPGNDRAQKWIEVAGGPRILLVTAYADDPLQKALSAQGFDVQIVKEPAKLGPGLLTGTKVVILNNVPAYRLPNDFLGALDFYVEQQGGGLVMAGGKYSFGSGGYFESPIDHLLPVSMELRNEHRKLATAMAVVLDRSGSMSATIPGGRQKIDLADEGAARSIELLGAMDAVAVFAVDTDAHAVVPLTRLEANRAPLLDAVRRITSAGGGICVPTGLRAAEEQLLQAPVGQRHVVLFADANDATQELGDYPALIKQMVGEGITISVIGLGDEHDSGGDFLKEVASLGHGRIFFNQSAEDLPALFAQETVTVARSAFLDKPVGVNPAAGWMEIASRPMAWLPEVDGYNLSYLKPDATAAAFSKDEYTAPLIAFWQRGAGRAAAVSFPLGGEFSDRTRAWEHYGDFAQTLARWVAGEALPPGLGLQTHLEGTVLRLDLFYDGDWEKILSEAAPRIVLGEGASKVTREITWERLEPGHYRAAAPLEPEKWVRGAIQAGKYTIPFGPIMAGSNAEWTFDPARLTELLALSRASGGVERIDLTGIWKAPRREEFADLRPWLLTALLVLFVLDAWLSRLGWKWGR